MGLQVNADDWEVQVMEPEAESLGWGVVSQERFHTTYWRYPKPYDGDAAMTESAFEGMVQCPTCAQMVPYKRFWAFWGSGLILACHHGTFYQIGRAHV